MPYGLDDIPWTIVLYAPENDFIGTIKDNRLQNALIAIFVVASTALLGLALANRILAPVRAPDFCESLAWHGPFRGRDGATLARECAVRRALGVSRGGTSGS